MKQRLFSKYRESQRVNIYNIQREREINTMTFDEYQIRINSGGKNVRARCGTAQIRRAETKY